jgi:hypothetical protein
LCEEASDVGEAPSGDDEIPEELDVEAPRVTASRHEAVAPPPSRMCCVVGRGCMRMRRLTHHAWTACAVSGPWAEARRRRGEAQVKGVGERYLSSSSPSPWSSVFFAGGGGGGGAPPSPSEVGGSAAAARGGSGLWRSLVLAWLPNHCRPQPVATPPPYERSGPMKGVGVGGESDREGRSVPTACCAGGADAALLQRRQQVRR